MKPIAPTLALFAAFAAAPALAQTDHSAHGAHGTEAGAGAANASTQAFEEVNARMHADMAVEWTGEADADFVRAMIPHHQGAIDMANVVLEHGEDPEIRALAEEIVGTQEAEIAEMRQWLADNGHGE